MTDKFIGALVYMNILYIHATEARKNRLPFQPYEETNVIVMFF